MVPQRSLSVRHMPVLPVLIFPCSLMGPCFVLPNIPSLSWSRDRSPMGPYVLSMRLASVIVGLVPSVQRVRDQATPRYVLAESMLSVILSRFLHLLPFQLPQWRPIPPLRLPP